MTAPRTDCAPVSAVRLDRAWVSRYSGHKLVAASIEARDELELGPETIAALSALAPRWALLKSQLQAAGPDGAGASHEFAFVALAADASRALDPSRVGIVRAMSRRVGTRVAGAELRTRDVTAHFALRQFSQALHDFHTIAGSMTVLHRELSQGDKAQLRALMESGVCVSALVSIGEGSPVRAELLLSMALALIDADVAVFATWTCAAAEATRSLLVHTVVDGWASVRADLARARARNEHAEWTAEDVDDEFAPWTDSAGA